MGGRKKVAEERRRRKEKKEAEEEGRSCGGKLHTEEVTDKIMAPRVERQPTQYGDVVRHSAVGMVVQEASLSLAQVGSPLFAHSLC